MVTLESNEAVKQKRDPLRSVSRLFTNFCDIFGGTKSAFFASLFVAVGQFNGITSHLYAGGSKASQVL